MEKGVARMDDGKRESENRETGRPCRADNAQGGFFREVEDAFDLREIDIRTYSPLTLAFLGDDIYDLVIRSLIVGRENVRPNRLHAHASHLVKAEAQAALMDALETALTGEEADWYRRGRNAKSPTVAKNASTEDYRKATGCETLMGWLYLSGQEERLLELMRMGLTAIGAPEVEMRAD